MASFQLGFRNWKGNTILLFQLDIFSNRFEFTINLTLAKSISNKDHLVAHSRTHKFEGDVTQYCKPSHSMSNSTELGFEAWKSECIKTASPTPWIVVVVLRNKAESELVFLWDLSQGKRWARKGHSRSRSLPLSLSLPMLRLSHSHTLSFFWPPTHPPTLWRHGKGLPQFQLSLSCPTQRDLSHFVLRLCMSVYVAFERKRAQCFGSISFAPSPCLWPSSSIEHGKREPRGPSPPQSVSCPTVYPKLHIWP